MGSNRDPDEISKLYQFIALNALPYLKGIHQKTSQISILVWMMLLLLLGTFTMSAIATILLIRVLGVME